MDTVRRGNNCFTNCRSNLTNTYNAGKEQTQLRKLCNRRLTATFKPHTTQTQRKHHVDHFMHER